MNKLLILAQIKSIQEQLEGLKIQIENTEDHKSENQGGLRSLKGILKGVKFNDEYFEAVKIKYKDFE